MTLLAAVRFKSKNKGCPSRAALPSPWRIPLQIRVTRKQGYVVIMRHCPLMGEGLAALTFPDGMMPQQRTSPYSWCNGQNVTLPGTTGPFQTSIRETENDAFLEPIVPNGHFCLRDPRRDAQQGKMKEAAENYAAPIRCIRTCQKLSSHWADRC